MDAVVRDVQSRVTDKFYMDGSERSGQQGQENMLAVDAVVRDVQSRVTNSPEVSDFDHTESVLAGRGQSIG